MSARRAPGLGTLRVLPGDPMSIRGMVPDSIALRGPAGPEGLEPDEGKPLSRESLTEIDQLVAMYPGKKSALLPALWVAQKEQGYVGTKPMEQIAEKIGLSPADVASVLSFYTMYYTRPVGKYVIQACTTLSCYLRGADRMVDHIKRKLGIDVGETTADGKFTLLTVECLGSCDTAPMLQLNDDFHENLDPLEKVDRLLDPLE